MSPQHCLGPQRQRGAATLVVVMLLFFVVSLAAAYASRNLIFEQRTSTNQYRYTQSFEAAQAGLEWATAMLNAGRIDEFCLPSTDVAKTSFRQRYLSIETADETKVGNVTPALRDDGASLWAGCIFNGTTWTCSCPLASDTPPLTLAPPSTAGSFPAFAVRFLRVSADSTFDPTSPGVIRVEVNGCAEYTTECMSATRTVFYDRCGTTLCAMLALHSAARAVPVAAVTAKGVVSGPMTVVNDINEFDGKAIRGITIRAGGVVDTTGMSLVGASGNLGGTTVADDDSTLQSPALPDDSDQCRYCLFTAATGLWPAAYRDQPATLRIDCTAPCSGSTIATAAGLNPGRVIWLRGAGGLVISGSSDIGSSSSPVALFIEGPVEFSGTGLVHGLVYASSTVTLNSGGIRGALYAHGTVSGTSTAATLTYDPSVLRLLRLQSGSFVKVPGSWRDFP